MSALTTKIRRTLVKFKNKCPTCRGKVFDKLQTIGVYSMVKCRKCGTVIQLHPSNWYELISGPDRDFKKKSWWMFWK